MRREASSEAFMASSTLVLLPTCSVTKTSPQIGISRVPWPSGMFRPAMVSNTFWAGNSPYFWVTTVRSAGFFASCGA